MLSGPEKFDCHQTFVQQNRVQQCWNILNPFDRALIKCYFTFVLELNEKWEARRAAERARLEAERLERERKAKEEAERKAAEEARRKEEEERLRREQAEAAGEGEGEEGGDKEEEKEAEEGKEGQEETTEEAKEDEEKEESAPAEAEPKPSGSAELQPSAEDVSLDAAPEEEELSLDKEIPPNTPETEEFKNLRTNFDRDFPQLLSVLKGTNNIDPIVVSVEKETETLNQEVLRRIEGKRTKLC